MIWFKLKSFIIFQLCTIYLISAFPDPGKWDFYMNADQNLFPMQKSLFTGSKIYVQINCDSAAPNTAIIIQWSLIEMTCLDEYVNVCIPYQYGKYYGPIGSSNISHQIKSVPVIDKCMHNIILREMKLIEAPNVLPIEKRANDNIPSANTNNNKLKAQPKLLLQQTEFGDKHIFQITKDGFYIFKLEIHPANDTDFNVSVHVEMQGTYGYLSAADWPLLPFYACMCLVYFFLGIIWLVVSFMQWRDLLRIQFWIGGVILLGMLEKAMFYAEYQNLNSTGTSSFGLILAAECVWCAKRTLARMLVIIVSLGFGIVKPRLGSMLHRVVGTGALYFILASVESYLRVMQGRSDPSNQNLVASIPLAVLDSAICWWIFTSLVQTTRTLRLRRNMVKLALYRHFTNTLIFSVIASVIFMLYSIKTRMARCLTDWKETWANEAFWHVLFSFLLLVIMILWRPTNNNQRYAFTPLLDNPEDEDDDDDEEDQFVADAYGVKMRGNRSSSPKPQKNRTTEEDDLKWVEENIPAAIADAALPILDSDEEIINTKFEVSKMQ